jgi:hypothetical protein
VRELGPPIAYLALEEGTPVYDRRGERVGVAEHVLADEQHDIFEGVIVHTLPLPGRHLYADAEQIAELHERGVLLSVDGDALHEPPGERESPRRDESLESPLQARLRRAWDWLNGR